MWLDGTRSTEGQRAIDGDPGTGAIEERGTMTNHASGTNPYYEAAKK
jgi:hypothetical protein